MGIERVPKVFVTQELPVSYHKAEHYGEVIFLSSREATQNSNSLRNADLLRDMIKAMRDYSPGVDWLVPSGSPIAIGLGFMIASWKGGVINILQWDSRGENYREYSVNLDILMDKATSRN